MVKFARESSVVRTWADARAFCWLRRQAWRLYVSGELAITSSGRDLELLLLRHVSREQMHQEKIKGDDVSRGTPRDIAE
jgi:hypothetical protein